MMDSSDSFAVGQVWKGSEHWYVIGRVDVFDAITVVSITAYNNAELTEEFAAHLPFSEATFRASVVELLQEEDGPLSDSFADGYNTWRTAWDKGEAGAW